MGKTTLALQREGADATRADATRLDLEDPTARERLDVIYPGTEVSPVADRIRAVGIASLPETLPGTLTTS